MDAAEQFARLGLDAKFAQAVAAVVERDRAGKTRADIRYAEDVDEEFGEFVDLWRHLQCVEMERGFLKELGIKTRIMAPQEPDALTITSLSAKVFSECSATARASSQ